VSHYKLRIGTVGTYNEGDAKVAIAIPRGSVLKISDDRRDALGFVDADWDGTRVRVFAIDLQNRGDLVQARSA
jgi:hypothetical protein